MLRRTKARSYYMADVCIIYSHANKILVERLDSILSERYSVWRDRAIRIGDYRKEIEKQLGASKCVIPVWCSVSREDHDVIDEASFAKDRGVPLLPVRTERVAAPLGFGPL